MVKKVLITLTSEGGIWYKWYIKGKNLDHRSRENAWLFVEKESDSYAFMWIW